MPIPSRWLKPSGLFWFYPNIFVSIKDSKTAMIFLAVIASKDKEFFMVQSGCMVLDLGCSTDCWT
jgi:hypothetical protein